MCKSCNAIGVITTCFGILWTVLFAKWWCVLIGLIGVYLMANARWWCAFRHENDDSRRNNVTPR